MTYSKRDIERKMLEEWYWKRGKYWKIDIGSKFLEDSYSRKPFWNYYLEKFLKKLKENFWKKDIGKKILEDWYYKKGIGRKIFEESFWKEASKRRVRKY